MLEFDENRNGPAPRGSRRAPGRLCVLAILLLATAAGLLVRSRRGAAAHDGPSDWCGIGAAELSAALLDAGATRLSAWPALEKAVEKASGGQVTGAALPATFFGREFTRIPGCAWLVPADGMREFVHLLLGSGIRLRHVGLGYSGSILVDDASPELEGRPPHTGIFIDEDGGFAARFVPSDEWVRDATSRIAEPTVPQLAPLLQRAPDSPALLRYLASIADARAAAAIDARIAELTQRFPNLPAPLGDEILWRGSRTEGDGTIRHCFQVKGAARAALRDCVAKVQYLAFDGAALGADAFLITPDSVEVTSFSSETDTLEFSMTRAMPDGIAGTGRPWSLEMRLTRGGAATGAAAVQDFLEATPPAP